MSPEIALLVAGVVAAAFVLFTRRGRVDALEARRLVGDGALLLDVRSPAEYADGALPGAVNVPVTELGGRVGELPRDRAVVLYCASGFRSATAARLLKQRGFSAVYDLGAMSRWRS